MKYSGPTYYGHPYLDGRGVFFDGQPLDEKVPVEPVGKPAGYVSPYAIAPKAPKTSKKKGRL